MIYNGDLTVREAMTKYFALNSLPADGGIDEKWVHIQFGPLPLLYPNSNARRQALPRHDLHHIVCDRGTSLTDEGIIAAWELGGGWGRHWITLLLDSQAMWWGILAAPHTSFLQFVEGQSSRSLYKEHDIHIWMDQTVHRLREHVLPNGDPKPAELVHLLKFTGLAVLGLILIVISMPFFLFPFTLTIAFWYFLA